MHNQVPDHAEFTARYFVKPPCRKSRRSKSLSAGNRAESLCLCLGKRGSIHRGARSLELGGLRRWFSCKYLDICCKNRLAAHPNSSAAHPRELIRASLEKPIRSRADHVRASPASTPCQPFWSPHCAVLLTWPANYLTT